MGIFSSKHAYYLLPLDENRLNVNGCDWFVVTSEIVKLIDMTEHVFENCNWPESHVKFKLTIIYW